MQSKIPLLRMAGQSYTIDYEFVWHGENLFVDLGAERLLAAERGTEKIAVEIKSFTSPSDMRALEQGIGQFVLYARLLKRYYPEYILYLAVSENTR